MFQQIYSQDPPENQLDLPGVLAVVSFGSECRPPDLLGMIPTGLVSLSGESSEVIRYGSSTAVRGACGSCQWSVIDDMICMACWVPAEDCDDIEKATKSAYVDIYRQLAKLGFEQVFRFWNFIPNINSGDGDCEEYKKFCVGRARAFEELGISEDAFPAASALGHHSEGAVIYALACHHSGTHHDNPKQVSAYHYPRQYGPMSPSFARASCISFGEQEHVFVSGTASILGHETKAAGALSEQIRITLDNISVLINGINAKDKKLSAVRVYLRNSEDQTEAELELASLLPDVDKTFLLADICRANLLVEIEALVTSDR